MLAIILLWWDISRQPAITPSFDYSTDSITTKVYYDSESGKAKAPQYSKTNLHMVYETKNNQHIIQNTVGETNSDNHVGLWQNDWPIDVSKGVYKDNGKVTDDYILAPRNLSKGQTFYHYHPSLSKHGLMYYQAEEMMGNLKVFRYEGKFSDSTYLPLAKEDVADASSEKLAYSPKVQLWVEPVSGWVVKYFAEVDIRFANTANNRPGAMYAHVSEVMTDDSTAQHVAYAETQKLKYNFVKHIVPSVFFSVTLVIILYLCIAQVKSRKVPIYASVGAVIAVAVAVLIGWAIDAQPLITFFNGHVGINPLTAVCFILTSLAVICLYNRRHPIASFIGVIITSFAGLQILATLYILPFSVDLLLFKDAVLNLDPTVYSRMPAFVAFTFLLLGISLIKAGLSSKRSKIHFAHFVIGIVLTISLIGIALSLTDIERIFALKFSDPFSIVTWALFVVCSFTLLQLFRTLNDIPDAIMHTLHTVRWPAIATIPIIAIMIWTQFEKNTIALEMRQTFNQQMVSFEKSISERAAIPTATLGGIRGLFSASQEVTAAEFHRYAADYLREPQTAIRTIGFAKLSEPSVAKISFLESLNPSDVKYQGYDLLSDAALRSVMESARDSGYVVMSNKTTSLLDADEKRIQTLVFSPIFSNEKDTMTVNERRQALEGYVFASIDLQKILNASSKNYLSGIDMKVYDGMSADEESLLYLTPGQAQQYAPRITQKRTIFIANRLWTIEYVTKPSFGVNPVREALPGIILFGGTSIYFAIIAIGYFIVRMRRQLYNRS